MTNNRTNDNYILNMDKQAFIDLQYCLMKHVQKRPDDFKLNLDLIPAFTRRGIWDHDKSEHLNIHSLHQIITVRDGMLLVEDGRIKQPLYRNMAALIPAGKPHLLKVAQPNQ